jgi:hypothetical protein
MVRAIATASTAPPAPNECPVTPLTLVTNGRLLPKTRLVAAAYAASLSAVEVPCALM